jgi:hypothetical protein
MYIFDIYLNLHRENDRFNSYMVFIISLGIIF